MDKLEKELYEIIIREIYINSDTAEDLAKVIANKIKPRKLRAVEQLRAADRACAHVYQKCLYDVKTCVKCGAPKPPRR